MPQLRLIGLVLFITSIFVALAAVATHTTHIRFKKPSRTADGKLESPWQTGSESTFENLEDHSQHDHSVGHSDADHEGLQFFSVPVVYPLCGAGMLGLFLWFAPAPRATNKNKVRRRPRRR